MTPLQFGGQTSADVQSLFEEKLALSDLTVEDARHLGIVPLDAVATTTKDSHLKTHASMFIPYFDPITGHALSSTLNGSPFYRVRYLGDPLPLNADGKPLRYQQSQTSGCCAYFPTLPDYDWSAILEDATQPITITEGELKAACACKAGITTVALGGVWNFAVNKIDLLPELVKIPWLNRHTNIIFDTDIMANKNICNALKRFSDLLERRGARPHVVYLPQSDDVKKSKSGLDDCIVERGAAYIKRWIEDYAEPIGMAAALFKLNEEIIYIRDPGVVMDKRSFFAMKPNDMVNHAYSTRLYNETFITPATGKVKSRPVSAAKAWMEWPMREEAGGVTYNPALKPGEVSNDYLGTTFNMWTGWGITQLEGDVTPFLELMDFFFESQNDARQWFLSWLACPLQNPGLKLPTAVTLHSEVNGLGKSVIGDTMAMIYGPRNYTSIHQREVFSDFNFFIKEKQMVMIDDMTGTDRRDLSDMLKKLITQKVVNINIKNVPQFTVPDCVNYLITTNSASALSLGKTDRRHFVHTIYADRMPQKKYDDYQAWLAKGGARHIFHYLANLDLTGFDAHAPALVTSSKEKMRRSSMNDAEAWIQDVIETPDHTLKIGNAAMPLDLYPSQALLDAYHAGDINRKMAIMPFGRALVAERLEAARGTRIPMPDGSKFTYYAVRNADRWRNASSTEVREYLLNAAGTKKKPKF